MVLQSSKVTEQGRVLRSKWVADIWSVGDHPPHPRKIRIYPTKRRNLKGLDGLPVTRDSGFDGPCASSQTNCYG